MRHMRFFSITAIFALSILLFPSCAKSGDASNPSQKPDNEGKPRIAIIVPGTVTPETDLTIEALKAEYGAAEQGGFVAITRLDQGNATQDIVRNVISTVSETPGVKAIIAVNALPGTADAFRIARKRHPLMLFAAAGSFEDRLSLEASAHLVISVDPTSKGWFSGMEALKLGANEVSLSVPALKTLPEGFTAFSKALKVSCAARGIAVSEYFEEATGKNPLDTAKKKVARSETLSKARKGYLAPAWYDRASLVDFLAGSDGYPNLVFISQAKPGFLPFLGFFGIKTPDAPLDWLDLSKELEKNAGAYEGKVASWIYPEDYALLACTFDFVRAAASGNADIGSMDEAQAWFGKRLRGVRFALDYAVDPASGIRAKSHFTFMEDSWVPGTGFLGLLDTPVPENLKVDQ